MTIYREDNVHLSHLARRAKEGSDIDPTLISVLSGRRTSANSAH